MTPTWPRSRPPLPRIPTPRRPSSAAAPPACPPPTFVGRAGIPVTIFERADCLGGVVRQVIPAWRISDDAIDKDAALMFKMGVEVKLQHRGPLRC